MIAYIQSKTNKQLNILIIINIKSIESTHGYAYNNLAFCLTFCKYVALFGMIFYVKIHSPR